MGFINNLAGAGGALGLLALDLGAGLEPRLANASLRPAALAIGLMGAIGFASKNQRPTPESWRFGLYTIPGAVLGAFLALKLPSWVYEAALLTTVCWLGAQLVLGKRSQSLQPIAPRRAQLAFLGVGFYMGFLQVGTGLVTMLALRSVYSQDLIRVNAAKMIIVLFAATTSVITFSVTGGIQWGPAMWVALGCGLGSFLAARFSLARGQGMVRPIVLAVCVVTALRSLYHLVT